VLYCAEYMTYEEHLVDRELDLVVYRCSRYVIKLESGRCQIYSQLSQGICFPTFETLDTILQA